MANRAIGDARLAMARAGQLRDAVYAPLRWGYRDQEPLESNRLNQYPSWYPLAAKHFWSEKDLATLPPVTW